MAFAPHLRPPYMSLTVSDSWPSKALGDEVSCQECHEDVHTLPAHSAVSVVKFVKSVESYAVLGAW